MPVEKLDVKLHCATWIIKIPPSMPPDNSKKALSSPTHLITEEFSVELPTEASWWMHVSLSVAPKDVGLMKLYLCRGVSVPGPELSVHYSVSILAETNNVAHIRQENGTFRSMLNCSDWNHLICCVKLKRFHVFDSIRIHMKIWAGESVEAPICLHNENMPEKPSTDDPFSAVFRMWYLDQTLADMTVAVKNEEFRIHKLVFASRSSVFKSMFQHRMQESISGSVTIPNCEPEVFRKLVEFMYTGVVEGLESCACDLLKVADMYDVRLLKLMCEEHIISTLTVANAFEMFAFADLHNAEVLREKVRNFIMNPAHIPDFIRNRESFELTSHTDPE
uniref:Speckle-type POZ protein n=1 Tax=Lygus hesperus TaxID=30085 RepID=A0A0A9YU46_LYGHE